MFGMWFGRGLPLARGFHWISLPLPILSLYWTSCHRNQSPATVRRTVHFILGQPRGRELLERDRNSKQHAVPDMIALGQSLNWSSSLFSKLFPDHYEIRLCVVSDGFEEVRGFLVPPVDLSIHLLRPLGDETLLDFVKEPRSDLLSLVLRLYSEVIDPASSSVPATNHAAHDHIVLLSD